MTCVAGCDHGWLYSRHDGSRSLCPDCDGAIEYQNTPEEDAWAAEFLGKLADGWE